MELYTKLFLYQVIAAILVGVEIIVILRCYRASKGTRMAAKTRKICNKLSKEEREKLLTRAMKIVKSGRPPKTIDEYCGQPEGSFQKFIKEEEARLAREEAELTKRILEFRKNQQNNQ